MWSPPCLLCCALGAVLAVGDEAKAEQADAEQHKASGFRNHRVLGRRTIRTGKSRSRVPSGDDVAVAYNAQVSKEIIPVSVSDHEVS